MVKPDAYMNMGKVFDAIYKNGFKINRLKMCRFNATSVAAFYKEHVGAEYWNNLSGHMVSDVSIGMELVAENAVEKWRTAMGPTNTQTA